MIQTPFQVLGRQVVGRQKTCDGWSLGAISSVPAGMPDRIGPVAPLIAVKTGFVRGIAWARILDTPPARRLRREVAQVRHLLAFLSQHPQRDKLPRGAFFYSLQG